MKEYMLERIIRPTIQPYCNIPSLLLARRLTPNHITLCAFLTGLLSALLIATDYTFLAIALLWLSGVFDLLDGSVARLMQIKTAFGAFIDLISDRLVESFLIFGFAYRAPEYMWAYLFFLTSLLFHFSTFVTAGALFKNNGNKSIHHEYSYIERAEAFIGFSLMILFPNQVNWLLTLLSIGIVLDAFHRLLNAYRTQG